MLKSNLITIYGRRDDGGTKIAKCYAKTEVDITYYIFMKYSCLCHPTSVGTFNVLSPIESPLEIISTKIHVYQQTNKSSASPSNALKGIVTKKRV